MLEKFKYDLRKIEQSKSPLKYKRIGKKEASLLLKELESFEEEVTSLRNKIAAVRLAAK